MEDLWAFNEEAVARAIAGSAIPIISAVGHEVDYTISDFVADLRAPTPSAAAEIISLHREETSVRVATYFQRMTHLVRSQLQEGSRRLETIRGRYGFQRPADLLLTFSQRIDELSERMGRSENSLLEKFRKTWESLGRHLSGLSPLAVLERGYSITFTGPQGKVVKDAESVALNQTIVTRLAKGELTSRITGKK